MRIVKFFENICDFVHLKLILLDVCSIFDGFLLDSLRIVRNITNKFSVLLLPNKLPRVDAASGFFV